MAPTPGNVAAPVSWPLCELCIPSPSLRGDRRRLEAVTMTASYWLENMSRRDRRLPRTLSCARRRRSEADIVYLLCAGEACSAHRRPSCALTWRATIRGEIGEAAAAASAHIRRAGRAPKSSMSFITLWRRHACALSSASPSLSISSRLCIRLRCDESNAAVMTGILACWYLLALNIEAVLFIEKSRATRQWRGFINRDARRDETSKPAGAAKCARPSIATVVARRIARLKGWYRLFQGGGGGVGRPGRGVSDRNGVERPLA